ncbi:MAG: hypothetical protein ACI9MR_004517 [Myxococcota bacterium]|jgi:hypothetical protein
MLWRFLGLVALAASAAGCCDDTAATALDDTTVTDSTVADTGDADLDSADTEFDVADTVPDTSDTDTDTDSGGGADTAVDTRHLPTLSSGASPCENPDYWPYAVASSSHPFVVRYQEISDRHEADRVRRFVETAWTAQVDSWGMRAPLDDSGDCGDSGDFDVFLWRGQRANFVDELAEVPTTPINDRTTYMVVDPWGEYAGAALASLVAHELHHAFQATDDWWDITIAYEMSATFAESRIFADDGWAFVLDDFQSRADHALDWDDGYETYYMYGASLYLHFLSERYFGGDVAFIGSLWQTMRSPAGAETDASLNEPDFADGIDTVLAEVDSSYVASIVAFARWRWFMGQRDDGQHLEDAARYGNSPVVPTRVVRVADGGATLSPAPMLLGSIYLTLAGAPGSTVTISVTGDDVAWTVQAVDAAEDDSVTHETTVVLGDDGLAPVVVTAIPLDPASYDPDTRTDDRYVGLASWE